jgi:hypothetical protein
VRRAAKVDANHNAIADYLRGAGWSVLSLATLGRGVPDLLVGRPRLACLVEVKDGNKIPSKQRLNEDQMRFRENWTGPYVIAYSPEDAHAKLTALMEGQ